MTVGRGLAGGSEEILRLMDIEMTRQGIRSIVIAGLGSQVAGELVPTLALNGDYSDATRAEAQRVQQRTIESVLARERVDLIHFHGLDFLAYRPAYAGVPQLATLHLPLSWYPADLFEQKGLALNFVSHTQARLAPANYDGYVVTNGVDLDHLQLCTEKGSYLLWLGRICPEKAPHIALRVAHRLQLPFVLAGPIHPFPSHLDYFAQEVKPLLDEQRVYVCAVNAEPKYKLLRQAACLLVPSLVEETSCLVAMEAIASGTPVVAFPSGALPEVVDHGTTGFLADSEEEMALAVGRAGELSPGECRAVAERRFSGVRMASEYLTLYRTLIANSATLAPQ